MNLKVTGSSSGGNNYIIENDDETECLVIELGFNFKEIKKALNYNLSKVTGCILTHSDGDHAKGVESALRYGMDVVMSNGCATKLGILGSSGVSIIKHGEKVKRGRFTIMAFDVNHDAPETLGYLIHHPDTGLICFLTDTYFSEFVFPDVAHMIVEANYSEDILESNYKNNTIHPKQYARVKRSHFSVENCIKFLKAHDLKKVKTITLIHLSPRNSDSDLFKQKVVESTGRRCKIARPGLIVNLSEPF